MYEVKIENIFEGPMDLLVYLIRKNHVKPIKGRLLNLPIGVDESVSPALMGITLQKGDRLFLYTDGITEQVNRSGEEFGEDRLRSVLSSLSRHERPLNELLPESIDLFSEGVPQQDDMSFLLFTYEA